MIYLNYEQFSFLADNLKSATEKLGYSLYFDKLDKLTAKAVGFKNYTDFWRNGSIRSFSLNDLCEITHHIKNGKIAGTLCGGEDTFGWQIKFNMKRNMFNGECFIEDDKASKLSDVPDVFCMKKDEFASYLTRAYGSDEWLKEIQRAAANFDLFGKMTLNLPLDDKWDEHEDGPTAIEWHIHCPYYSDGFIKRKDFTSIEFMAVAENLKSLLSISDTNQLREVTEIFCGGREFLPEDLSVIDSYFRAQREGLQLSFKIAVYRSGGFKHYKRPTLKKCASWRNDQLIELQRCGDVFAYENALFNVTCEAKDNAGQVVFSHSVEHEGKHGAFGSHRPFSENNIYREERNFNVDWFYCYPKAEGAVALGFVAPNLESASEIFKRFHSKKARNQYSMTDLVCVAQDGSRTVVLEVA